MPYTVARFEPTPNPNALKCILDRPISDRPRSFRRPADAEGDPVAARFFAIEGVSGLLLNGGWLTVNKSPEAEWPAVKRAVQQTLAALP